MTVQGRDAVIRIPTIELAGAQLKGDIRFDFSGELAHLFDPASGLNLI